MNIPNILSILWEGELVMKIKESRPRQVLKDVGRNYPNAWKQVKMFREDKGVNLPNWADWCYIPLAVGVAIGTAGDDSMLMEAFNSSVVSPAVIVAAATWKLSQGVYKFDYDLYESLINQPMDDKLPCETLKRLPEYCVYIETHNAKIGGSLIDGFLAHLEEDVNDGRMELRFVFLGKDGKNLPFAVHLGDWTLDEGLERMQEESRKQARIHKLGSPLPSLDFTSEITPFLQLVLYLCAENIDISKKPLHPSKRANRDGTVNPVKATKRWDVGQRIGSTIRKYRNEEIMKKAEGENVTSDVGPEKDVSTTLKSSPRPHVRRSHWHSFWKGPRDGKRELIVHWIPPIPVGINMDDDSPVVIHKVK